MELAITHDAMTSASVYSVASMALKAEIAGVRKEGLIVPVGITPDGQYAFVGDKGACVIHSLNPPPGSPWTNDRRYSPSRDGSLSVSRDRNRGT
jgi:hypothetical protein